MKNDLSKLTKDQFEVLSLLATMCKTHPEKTEYIRGIQASCTFAGIDDDYILPVILKQEYKGLRNVNKLSYNVYF